MRRPGASELKWGCSGVIAYVFIALINNVYIYDSYLENSKAVVKSGEQVCVCVGVYHDCVNK